MGDNLEGKIREFFWRLQFETVAERVFKKKKKKKNGGMYVPSNLPIWPICELARYANWPDWQIGRNMYVLSILTAACMIVCAACLGKRFLFFLFFLIVLFCLSTAT